MTPTSTPPPTILTVSHPASLSAADVLDIINSSVQTDAPVIVQALPFSANTSNRISAYVGLGEIGLAVINQIVQLLHQRHQQIQQAPPQQ